LNAGTSGAVEHGTHYQLKLAYEHNLQRTAFNFCAGSFGGVKGMNHYSYKAYDFCVPVFSLQEETSYAFSQWMELFLCSNKKALRFLAFFPMRCCLVPSDMFPALTVL
jgi:hypothetical protein